MSEADPRVIKECQRSTLAPFRMLREGGLERFFLHLCAPLMLEFSCVAERMVEWEDEFEKMVMGKEYDAKVAGKAKLPESRLWVRME